MRGANPLRSRVRLERDHDLADVLALRHQPKRVDDADGWEADARQRFVVARSEGLQNLCEPFASPAWPRGNHAREIDGMERDTRPESLQVQRLVRENVLLADLDEPAERLDEVEAARKKRSEEHTSELQSPDHLVCRLLLEKK